MIFGIKRIIYFTFLIFLGFLIFNYFLPNIFNLSDNYLFHKLTTVNPNLDYPYRASNKEEFDKCVKKIKLLGVGKRNHYLSILRDYCVEKYGDIDGWSNKLASFYNEF